MLLLASSPSRAFLTRTYPTMKQHNPSTPIMLREAAGTLPKVYARYDFGQEKSHSLEGTNEYDMSTYEKEATRLTEVYHTGLSDKQIEDAVTGLVQQSA